MNWKNLVYEEVQKIPKGKVSTYGKIAEQVNHLLKAESYKLTANVTPRMVGQALHKNSDPKNIPCHRVVNREGNLAKNFAFGGARMQKKLLLQEGVKFKDDIRVDLESV